MGVTPGCGRVGVSEEPPDNLQAETTGDEVAGECVPVVVAPVVFDFRFLQGSAPELLDLLQRLARGITWEEERRLGVSSLLHRREQGQGLRTERHILSALLLRVMAWLGPNPAIEVDFSPLSRENLAKAGASQELEADGIGCPLVGAPV